MKSYYIAVFLITCLGCSANPNKKNAPDAKLDNTNNPSDSLNNKIVQMNLLFNLTDAEKILGEPAGLQDSSTTINQTAVTYQSAYLAKVKDRKSNKTGNVYFLIRKFNDLDSSKREYTFIKTANEDHGIETLHNLGDEAYFHTDNENFYFIMVRKGYYSFRIKVNKITSKTSKTEFNKVAEKITQAI